MVLANYKRHYSKLELAACQVAEALVACAVAGREVAKGSGQGLRPSLDLAHPLGPLAGASRSESMAPIQASVNFSSRGSILRLHCFLHLGCGRGSVGVIRRFAHIDILPPQGVQGKKGTAGGWGYVLKKNNVRCECVSCSKTKTWN